jgi:glycine/D-amino acid oxidase-like deaminating enzyme
MDEMFDPAMIEACFKVREVAFDASLIAADLQHRLDAAGVDCRFGVTGRVARSNDGSVEVDTTEERVQAQYVFNCTYAYLDDLGVRISNKVKKELTEIALIEPSRAMTGRAITVMDGPFFSSMPFPALRCYSLTHVRYTPHNSWTEPGDKAASFAGSRAEVMMRDAARYMPCMRSARYLRSLYELKATLVKSEETDSRPIVFEKSADSDRVYSVLGSKLDNVYDVIAFLKRNRWNLH